MAVTTIADPFAGEVAGGIEEAALARGYSVILLASHSDPERELEAVRSFQKRRVDGVLVMASRIGAQYGPMLRGMNAPIVLINSHHYSYHAGEFVYWDAGRLAGYRSSWKTPAFAKTRIWPYMPMAVRRAGSYVAITAWKDGAERSFLLQRPAGAGSSQIVSESTAPPR